jgi:transcriptional regulator with XRE-family HTH domain
MAEINDFIAKRIKDLRTAAGLTQTQLAAKLGITSNTVSRWEGAVYYPSVGDLDQLARFFKRPIWVFLPIEDHPTTKEQSALLSATGDLPPEDLEELRRYADFVRARRTLRKRK